MAHGLLSTKFDKASYAYWSEQGKSAAAVLGLAKDLKRDYGASGSAQTTTGSMTSGSKTLTLADAKDFQNGQGIAIVHAGPGPYQQHTTTSLQPPTSLGVTNEGTKGSTTYTYWIASVDYNGGITAAVSVTTTTGNATLAQGSNYNKITWTQATGAQGYVIYGDPSNPTSSQGILGTSNNSQFLDMGLGPQGMGMGQDFTASDLFPAAYPTSALGDTLSTTIVSGGGTTTLTLADAASATVTDVWVGHDDNAACATALADIIAAGGGTLDFGDGTFRIRDGLTTTLSSAVPLRFTGRQTGGTGQIIGLPGYSGSVLDITGDSSLNTRVEADGLVIDGNKANNVYGPNEDTQCGIRIVNASWCSVHDNVARNTWLSPIRYGNGTGATGSSASPVQDSIVAHNRVYEGYDQGIAIWNSTRVTVMANVVERSGWSGISFTQSLRCTAVGNTSNHNVYLANGPGSEGHGLAMEGADSCTFVGNTCESNNAAAVFISSGPFTHNNSTNNVVDANTLRLSQLGSHGVEMFSSDACAITNNTVSDNTGQGILTHYNCTRIDIAGNTLRNNAGNQIDVSGSSGTPTGCNINDNIMELTIAGAYNGVRMNNVFRSTVADNILQGNNSAQAVILTNCDHIDVHDNTCWDWHGNAALNGRGVTYCNFHHNTVLNTQGTAALKLEDQGATYSLHNTVDGNTLMDNQATHTQTYGVWEAGSTDYTTIRGNRFSGNIDGPLSLVGAHSTAADNPGYNPVGALTAPTVPVSGTALTNSFHVRARYYVSGGTVSGIAINGAATGLTGGAFELDPGETITFTYSAAPTLAVQGL